MKCAICNCEDHSVYDTRETGNAIRRRRKCRRCGHRWTTYERDEAAVETVDTTAALSHLEALQALLVPRG